jgi:hypothetical protein
MKIWLPFSILIVAALITVAHGRAVFPSVADLQAQLHIIPGLPLAREVQGPNGEVFRVYVLSGRSRGNGIYDVTVKLDR